MAEKPGFDRGSTVAELASSPATGTMIAATGGANRTGGNPAAR
jgi:hypothetical protein